MRITIIGPVYPYRGGIAHYTSHLARKLINGGHETQTISFKRQYPAWLYPGKSDKDPSAEPLTVSAEYLLDPFYPWTWWQTLKSISRFDPQIIAIQWWTTFWAPAFTVLGWLLQKKGMRAIFIIHNVLPHEEKVWDRWFARMALSLGKGFLVHTQRESERLTTLLPNADVKKCSIPVYDDLTHPTIPKTEARELLGLPQDIPILLFFGIVRPYKGLSVLLDALGMLHQRNKDFYLLIAGEFWDDKTPYIQKIEHLGLEKHVHIEDRYLPDEEVAQIFSAVDVLVAPYVGGTQSAVASWGLGFGLPLIISDKVAAGILENNLSHAKIVPAGDHLQLAEAIENTLLTKTGQQVIHQHTGNVNSGWDDLIQKLASFIENG